MNSQKAHSYMKLYKHGVEVRPFISVAERKQLNGMVDEILIERGEKEAPETEEKEKKKNTRGDCVGFSRWSRRRLFNLLATINTDLLGSPVFLTLTYHLNFAERDFKRDLKVYIQQIRELDPGISLLWRLEPQDRGAPHYHLIIWGGELDFQDEKNQKILCDKWHNLVDPGDNWHRVHGAKVDKLETFGKIYAYVSKYVAKADGKKRGLKWGRRWGTSGDLPCDPLAEQDMSRGQAVELKRLCRSWLKSQGLTREIKCHRCNGKGYLQGKVEKGKCPVCEGSGKKEKSVLTKRYKRSIRATLGNMIGMELPGFVFEFLKYLQAIEVKSAGLDPWEMDSDVDDVILIEGG
jgi:hypothetical protein